MRKLTLKHKILAMMLFLCIGIVPNDEPAEQKTLDITIAKRDKVKAAVEEEEKKALAYFEDVYAGRLPK
jgi:hypothetical protein